MKKKLLFGFMAVMLVAGTILAGCAAPAPEEGPAPAPAEKVYEWKLVMENPRATEQFFEAEEFATNVEAMSKGRLKVEVYAIGELMESEEYFNATREGTVQLADCAVAKFAEIPYADVMFGIPFGISKIEELSHLFWDEGLNEWVREKMAPLGIYYLGARVEDGFVLWSKEPIYRIADLEGVKVRAFGAAAEMVAALGASVVYVPWSECYLAVSTGVVDSICTEISCGYDVKLYEPCKGLALTPIVPFVLPSRIVNMDAWNELPDDLKAIVTLAGQEWAYRADRMLARVRGLVTEMEEKYGVTATTWPDEDVAKARELAKEIWKKLGEEDPLAAEMLKIKLDYMKKMGYTID